MFSDTLLVVRDASCWTTDPYKAFFGGGVDGAEAQARVTEKKRSLCSWPSRLKTRPGCCSLSRHCLLKCWHLALNEGFKFSQNILEMQYGKNALSFPVLIWRHSICSLISLRWLHPKASDHPSRSDGGSCSLEIRGFTDPKNYMYNYEFV